jgi:type III restriction enzyme
MSEADYSLKETDGQLAEIDRSDKGKVATKFLTGLHQQMSLLASEQTQTAANLAYWLDKTIPHRDITPTETAPYLTALLQHLTEERNITLGLLFHDKYRLRQAVETKIQQHRSESRKKSYQAFLLPECETPLVVTPEVCFSFDPLEYPNNSRYQGAYEFNKHYYKEVGNLKPEGEEYECAVFLDTLPEVKFWVRNIERRERHSFWLQTSTDRFYPDFVCQLNDGRYLVVEYKGADRWSDDDSKEKRALGELWELRSNGKCMFVMPKGKDFGVIGRKAE